jgi:hypothetical protein
LNIIMWAIIINAHMKVDYVHSQPLFGSLPMLSNFRFPNELNKCTWTQTWPRIGLDGSTLT